MKATLLLTLITLAPRFGGDLLAQGSQPIEDIALLPNGQFLTLAGNTVTRFHKDGTIDQGFSTPGFAAELAIENDMMVLVRERLYIRRFDPNGVPLPGE